MPQCPGCKKTFSSGYSNHLEQTQNSPCRAVLAEVFRDRELWSESLASDTDTESSDSDAPVTNYLEFDSDDEEEDLMYGANDYGEAPIPEQLEDSMDVDEPEDSMDVNEPEDNQEVENDLCKSREVRWAAEEAFRKKPVVKVFPSAKASAPITNIQALPRYDSYKTRLKNSDNP
jgi:hypothetical protein